MSDSEPRPNGFVPAMLQRLRADHAQALLAFEQDNRAYFAASITDRGDAYFAEFAERHAMLLAEQVDGTCRFHVLVDLTRTADTEAPGADDHGSSAGGTHSLGGSSEAGDHGGSAGGAILGRVNLIDVAGGTAELGYRIAERATGQGLATAAVREVCARAASEYGLTELHAVTTLDNAASRAVLARTGFVVTGETVAGGRPGLRYVRDLSEDLQGSG